MSHQIDPDKRYRYGIRKGNATNDTAQYEDTWLRGYPIVLSGKQLMELDKRVKTIEDLVTYNPIGAGLVPGKLFSFFEEDSTTEQPIFLESYTIVSQPTQGKGRRSSGMADDLVVVADPIQPGQYNPNSGALDKAHQSGILRQQLAYERERAERLEARQTEMVDKMMFMLDESMKRADVMQEKMMALQEKAIVAEQKYVAQEREQELRDEVIAETVKEMEKQNAGKGFLSGLIPPDQIVPVMMQIPMLIREFKKIWNGDDDTSSSTVPPANGPDGGSPGGMVPAQQQNTVGTGTSQGFETMGNSQNVWGTPTNGVPVNR